MARHGELWSTALAGMLVVVGLAGWLYLGHGWLGLPFVPFDITDAIIRLTPGAVATAGIEALGEGAKRVLLGVGILAFLAGGAGLGMLGARLRTRRVARALALAGVALAATVLAESVIAWNRADVAASVLWLAGSYAAAALILGVAVDRLSIRSDDFSRSGATGTTELVTTKEARGASGSNDFSHSEAQHLGRRSFLLRMAAAAGGAVVAGAALGSLGRASRVRQAETLVALPTTTPTPAGGGPAAAAAISAPPSASATIAAATAAPGDAGTGPAAAGATAPAEASPTTAPAVTPALAPAGGAPPPPGTPLPGTLPAFAAAPGTRPNLTPLEDFYVVNIATRDPIADLAGWRLAVKGLVDRPLALSYQDLLRFPRVDVPATLECISNPLGGDLISTGQFNGLRLADVLAQARPQAGAVEMLTRSLDGYTESIPVDKALRPDTLLIYGMDGLTLKQEHGYPLRLYNPNHYGMKNPKWLTEIEFVAEPYVGYWEFRGWDKEAAVKTTTILDTRGELAASNGIVQLGGIAFAGWRGIENVEVNIDNGEWQAAVLDTPLSPFTWVRWRYDWRDAAPGPHTILVRSVDGTGELQMSLVAAPHPDGASGWQKTRVIVKA